MVRIEKFDITIALKNLDKQMDSSLAKFIKDFYNSEDISFQAINQRLLNYFEQEILDYLDRRYLKNKKSTYKMQDYLFNNMGVISRFYLSIRLFCFAEDFWERILEIAQGWEKSRNHRVHKGSIYFFWAEVALLNNELDKGFLLVHSAYREDCITHEKDNPVTPAFLTASLNYKDKRNMLFGYLKNLSNFLNEMISNYNKRNSKHLSRRIVFYGYLSNPPSIDLLFSFTHTLARIYHLFEFESQILDSNFAGLYELNILFDLVLVIDRTIFSNTLTITNQNQRLFYFLAKKLLLDSKLERDENQCERNLTKVRVENENDFELTILNLLKRKFSFEKINSIPSLYYDICISYCIRNHSAHNIRLSEDIAKNFPQIFQSVINTFFLCVETYYFKV